MRLRAKYRAVCGVCGRRIVPGDRIEWARGIAPRHLDCTGQTGAERRRLRPRYVFDACGLVRIEGRV